MAGKRIQRNKVAEGLRSKIKNALSFGSARRNEVADSLNRRQEFELEEQPMEESYFDDFLNGEIHDGPTDSPSELPKVPVPPVNGPVLQSQDSFPPSPAPAPASDIESTIKQTGGMRAFAESTYKLNRINEVRGMFLLLINNYENVIKESPSNVQIREYNNKLENMKQLLEEFDTEVEVVRTDEKIQQDVEAINDILGDIFVEFKTMISEIDNGDYSRVQRFATIIDGKVNGGSVPTGYEVGSYTGHMRSLYSMKLRYENLTKRTYPNVDIHYIANDLAKRFYEVLATKVKELTSEIERIEKTDPNRSFEDSLIVRSLNSLIRNLVVLSNDSNELKLSMAEIDKKIENMVENNGQPRPVPPVSKENLPLIEALKKSFEIVLNKKYEVIFEKTKSLFSEFKTRDSELEKMIDDLYNFMDSEKTLSKEIKDEIRDKVSAKYDEKLYNVFGEALYEFVYDYASELDDILNRLDSCQYGTDEFELAYSNLKDFIAVMEREGNKLGFAISFDEDSQMLEIDFASSLMKPYKNQVARDDVIDLMRKDGIAKKGGASGSFGRDQEKERLKQEADLRTRLNDMYDEYDKLFIQELRQLKRNAALSQLEKEINEVPFESQYNALDDLDRNLILNSVRTTHLNSLYRIYSVKFIDLAYERLIPIMELMDVTRLDGLEYGTPSFAAEYKKIRDVISSFVNDAKYDGELHKFISKVDFDENTQVLSIEYNYGLPKFEVQVVSDEVLNKMHEEVSRSHVDTSEDQIRETLRNQLDEIYNEMDRFCIQELKELRISDDIFFLNRKIYQLLREPEYSILSDEERNDILDKVNREHSLKLSSMVSSQLVWFIRNFLIPLISRFDFDGTQQLSIEEFNRDQEQIMEHIHEIINEVRKNPNSSVFLKDICFDEESQSLKIAYENQILGTFERQIVSDEVLRQLRDAKSSALEGASSGDTVLPVLPVEDFNPLPDEMAVAVQDYINKLEEANSLVELINDINANLEAQAVMTFVGKTDAKSTVDLEKEAKELDQRLMSLRIELSKDRLAFKRKFDKFILAFPEVKAIETKEVVFSGNLNDFVKQHDEMIVEAENQIFVLDKERKDNPSRLAEINDEIQVLLDFIEAQNSLVGRRLVREAKESNLDIVSLLNQRRENKKEVRERLRQVRENTSVSHSEGEPKLDEEADQPAQTQKPELVSFDSNENDEDLRKQEELRVQRFKFLQELLEQELRKQVVEGRTSYNERTFRQNFMVGTKEYISELKGYYASEVIDTIIDKYEADYIRALNKENSGLVSELFDSIKRIQFAITREDVLEKEFEINLSKTLEDLVEHYSDIQDLTVEYNKLENVLIIKYTARKVNFDTNLIEEEPVQKYVGDFLEPSVYAAYMDNKKNDIEVDNQMLRTVGDYFIDGYSNGKVVFQSVAKNTLVKETGLSIEEIEVAIERLVQMGVIEDSRGLFRAICTHEEFLKLLDNRALENQAAQETNLGAEETKIDKGQVNIVQHGLIFNPRHIKQLADTSKAVITSGDAVTVSLIKNGIKIKYSQELREKLSQLNAKLSLVSKDYSERVSNPRVSVPIDEKMPEQEVTVNTGRGFSPEDYKIEIRVPVDGVAHTLYEFDLENVSDELKAHSK